MSENQAPRKPQRKGSAKKLNLSTKKTWQNIVNGVDKKEVPVNILQLIVVKLIDGTEVKIDVKELLSDGLDSDAVETLLNEKFAALDEYISNVDFFVDIDKVVKTIQPETDKVLKNL
jgi:hypothetical protein